MTKKRATKKRTTRAKQPARVREQARAIDGRERLEHVVNMTDIPFGVKKALENFKGEYDALVADTLLEKISEGMTLKDACLKLGIRVGHVRRWILDDLGADTTVSPPVSGMATRINIALSLQAEAWADDAIALADDADEDTVQIKKLQIETRKWLMTKNNNRFAEKSTIALEGGARPIGITSDMTEQEAAAAYGATLKKR